MSAPDVPPALEIRPLRPERVLATMRVEAPNALLVGAGDAVLHGELGDAEVVLDFGRERVGFVTLSASAAAEARLLVRYGETEEELCADTALELPWYRFPRDEFALAPGPSSLRSRGRRAFRFMRIGVPRCTAPVRLGRITVHHQHARLLPRGHFSSADPVLNGAWDLSAYTTGLCMQGYFEDGIKRDGLLWIGDARVQFLCAYHAFGDTALAERSLRMIAASQRDDGALPACAVLGGGHQHPSAIEYMPDVIDGVGRWIIDNYVTDFLGALREHHEHTGDAALLRELWPCALRAAAYLAQIPRDPPVEKNIITDENPAQRDSWWPSAGTFLQQLRGGMRDMAACARVLGDGAALERCRALIADVDRIVAASYRTAPGGVAADGVFCDRAAAPGAPPEVSWHANAFAVLGGAVDAADAAPLLQRVAAAPDPAYPVAGFMKFWVLKAMMDAGLAGQAVRDIRAYWGFMREHGASTCWEKLDLRHPERVLGNPAVSRCHGWTAGPCVLFPRYLLGLSPIRPGWERVAVRPFLPEGVPWMEGTVPTPRGDIFVRWEARGSGIEGCVVLPEGICGELVGRATELVPGANEVKLGGPRS